MAGDTSAKAPAPRDYDELVALTKLAEGTAGATGEALFRALDEHLAKASGTHQR